MFCLFSGDPDPEVHMKGGDLAPEVHTRGEGQGAGVEGRTPGLGQGHTTDEDLGHEVAHPHSHLVETNPQRRADQGHLREIDKLIKTKEQ